MKKNQNGVTLIALAVTIIVMLILAGVTRATLTGENGIITQSRRAAAASTEAKVKENMLAAYNSVLLAVQMDRSGNEAYDAQAHIGNYIDIIKNQIGTSNTYTPGEQTAALAFDSTVLTSTDAKAKYTVYVVKANASAVANKIYIDYVDTTFKLDLAENATANNKNEYPFLRMILTFDTNTVTSEGPTTHAISGN